MLTRLPLRTRVLLIFAALAGAILAFMLIGVWAEVRAPGTSPETRRALLGAAAIAGLGAVIAVGLVWYLFDQNMARPIEMLAGGLRTGQPPEIEPARYLADLGPAAVDAAEARARAAEDLSRAIREHAADLEREKLALDSVLADLGAGALMIDPDGRVIFFSRSLSRLLPGIALDRPADRYLPADALSAARSRLGPKDGATTELSCPGPNGTHLWGRMRRAGDNVLLILRDQPAPRRAPLDELETLRRHAAALVPMLDALDAPLPPELCDAIRAEGHALSDALRELGRRMAGEGASARATLHELAAGLDTPHRLGEDTVFADAAQVNGLLRHLGRCLKGQGINPVLTAERIPDTSSADEGAECRLTLTWQGDPVQMRQLEAWLAAHPDPSHPDMTGHQILAEHGTGIWPESGDGQARLVLPLRLAPPLSPKGEDDRALRYDLAPRPSGRTSSRLADLTCVVFDTETTGLDPRTDRIVQIAALRIVHGRLTGESFETLVNPGCPIPPSSTKIHGITDDMVRDAPDMASALAAFHHFAEDAVLVAHNAPFDMGFLREAAPLTGIHFDNRVLDTVLLSAMLWGQSAPHSLDALTRRLGITIPPGERHTAMGDTRATAQACLKLIAALEAKGLDRFEDILTEARRHRRLIEDANRPSVPGPASPPDGPRSGSPPSASTGAA